MDLPVMPPVKPMLCKAARDLPPAGSVLYEPKWDGFRCIVFRDGDEVVLGSRNERPLTRYFPELVGPLRVQLPTRCVVDGELVVATDHGLDFDALSQRIHPADSRVRMLAETTPASFVAFDLLALADRSLLAEPFGERRRLLEEVAGGLRAPLHLTPITADRELAADWFVRFEGAGLDGVVAKPTAAPYQPDKRVLVKVKHQRTADCVVAGFRTHKSGDGVGSLLLGLYDEAGTLHHVGVASSFSEARRRELAADLAPLTEGALEGHPWRQWAEMSAPDGATPGRRPGPGSRWDAGKDLSFTPVRIERVVEVAYEHLQGDRFRHTARFQRWRPDRQPSSCTYDQLERVPPHELADIFATELHRR
ncbi:MAG: ATP-dependent DNA ligase [Acidimicrobiales bacterium]